MRSKKIKKSQRVKRTKRVKRAKRVKRTRRNTKPQRGGMEKLAAAAVIPAAAAGFYAGTVGAIAGAAPALLGTAYWMYKTQCACENPKCDPLHDGKQYRRGRRFYNACSYQWNPANSNKWENTIHGWFCPNCPTDWGKRVGRAGQTIFPGADNATSPLGILSVKGQMAEHAAKQADRSRYRAAEEEYELDVEQSFG
jgi:hypothetical protein